MKSTYEKPSERKNLKKKPKNKIFKPGKKIIDIIFFRCYLLRFLEDVIKIDVKDNNVEQALRVLKRKLQRDGFFKIVKLKNTYEKPSEKKKRILQENIKRVKKLNKLKNRI